MWDWDYSLYLGDNSERDHIGFVTDTNFFVIAEGQDLDEDTFHGELEGLKQHIISEAPKNLAEFSALLQKGVDKLGEHLLSFVAALAVDNIMYFESRGNGEIYASRGGQTAKLIHGDQTASGVVQSSDTFLLTNRIFTDQVAEERLRNLMFNNTPQEIVDILTPELKGKNDTGMFGLFLQAKKKAYDAEMPIANTETVHNEPEPVYKDSYATEEPLYTSPPLKPQRTPILTSLLQQFRSGSPLNRRVTFVVVVILVGVLSWSVFSGNARRERAKFDEQVQMQKGVVEGKLKEAEDLAGLNTQKSLQLIDESRVIVRQLNTDAKKKGVKDPVNILALTKTIDATEQKIQKKEDGQAEEFYDLDLIENGTEASAIYSDSLELALLDTKRNKVYMLTLGEKSVNTYSAKSASKAQFVAIHQEVPYILGSEIGVVKLAEKNKQEEVIKKDNAWGTTQGFWMYNGNIYVLDASTPNIYKYLVAEGGKYSDKKNYLSDGQAGEIKGASAMAIDSSIYVAVGEKVLKYSSGAKVAFNVSIPDESDITFEDIYTRRDLDEVYLLDKDSQRIFITDKDGGFKKQISAKVLKDADDFVVTPEQGILVLSGNMIYRIKK